ncbi:MAG TPA: pre-peptidase C-terminal domain-containing protein [Candidatus Polarisedimenticolia bacterium]|nr:pre-peptidase C-terminal domain-containing protein [Candidatus Polarisedimenticolia bacterium]
MKNLMTLTARLFVFTALAAAIVFGAASPALANGPLANCQSGVPYLWPAGGSAIPFNPDQGDLGPVDNASAVALVQSAFDTWGAVPTATVNYVNAGPLPVDVDITNFGPYLDAVAPDGLSAIVFDDTGEIFDLLFGPGSGILGFAGPEWGTPATCTIDEGYSFLNGPAFTDATYAIDVMVHEFGHYTNLAHTAVNGQIFLAGDTSGPLPNNTFGSPASITVIETMYPFYFGPGSGTASLENDDIAGVSTLYPTAGYLAGTGTIRGTIFDANGTTRLSGVNVIARNVADPFEDAVSAMSGDSTDSTSQLDPNTGTYRLNGLTPGAQYAVYVDQILAGGFSTPPITLPGVEEFSNGAAESNNVTSPDPPAVYTPFTAVAGSPVTGANVIFNGFGPGEPIPLGDDDFVQISLPFTFSFCGLDYNSVYINSNGSLSFEAPSTDFSESTGEFLAGPPRIAGLWDDLNAGAGGTVIFTQSNNLFTVTFTGVPEFPASGSNTFAIALHRSSNQIDLTYGALSATDGLSGLSCGVRVTTGFETEVDLSALAGGSGSISPRTATAVFENFTAGDNDLDNLALLVSAPNAFKDTTEPNGTPLKATKITLPYSSDDKFTAIEPVGNDVDFFKVTLTAGSTFTAELVSGGFDSLIGLFNSTGALVAADDDSGAGLLSKINYAVPADGTYYIAVTAFPDFGFTGAGGSGGRFVMHASSVNGIVLFPGDDGSVLVPLPFDFPFNGTMWPAVFVNGNGNLTFGTGNSDFTESTAELLSGPPRIAPLWDDLNPGAGGNVVVTQTASSWTVEYQGVPEFGTTNSNTFSVTLHAGGQIDFHFGTTAHNDGLIGVSQGGGAADPGETDLSAAGALSATGTTYELFGSGELDLDTLTLLFF